MQDKENQNIQDVISVLQEKSQTIRDLEERAKDLLQDKNEVQEYNKTLRRKAELLRQLPEAVYPLLENLSRDMQSEIRIRLQEFAANAEQALEVNSPFFMSMLLYPEDYREGDKNDLEEFIQNLINNFS